MTEITRALLVLSPLISHPVDGAQLPREIRLDQLLLRTGRLIAADDLDAAVEAMDETSALAAEHELEFAGGLPFRASADGTLRSGYWRRRSSPLRSTPRSRAGRRSRTSMPSACCKTWTGSWSEAMRRSVHHSRRARGAGWNSPAIPAATSGIPPRRLRRPRCGRASVRPVSPRVPGH